MNYWDRFRRVRPAPTPRRRHRERKDPVRSRVGINPLGYGVDADRLFVISSKGGSDYNPHWFHNVVAHPQVLVEVGADTLHMQASISAEPERTRLFDRLATERPGFRDYQALTKRIMPVVILSLV